jgi:hypothetical protein
MDKQVTDKFTLKYEKVPQQQQRRPLLHNRPLKQSKRFKL